LDISPLFFYIVSKLIQALVITHDEFFQALAVEGEVLRPEPFVEPSHPLYCPESDLMDFHVLGKLKKHVVIHLMTSSMPRSRSHVCTSAISDLYR
jgi:hypothetical protein